MFLGAVMVPHPPVAVREIGKGEEKKIQTTIDGFRKAAAFIAQKKPELIILTSPHAVMYRDYFNVSRGAFCLWRLQQIWSFTGFHGSLL